MELCICVTKFALCFPCQSTRCINEITFPAPQFNLRQLEEALLSNPDLIWLNISNSKQADPTKIVPALYIKSLNSSEKQKLTVLYSHGNGEDIALEAEFVQEMSDRTGFDFLVYEYPGYSLARFTNQDHNKKLFPSEHKIYAASEAAWRFLVNEEKIPPNQILLYGRSIGSGPTVHLASRKYIKNVDSSLTPQHAAGVFLISPILSTIRAVCNPFLATVCFCYDKFPNHSKIKNVNAPVAIMHAKNDEVVKVYNGVTLHSKLKPNPMNLDPKWLETGGHNEIEADVILDYFLQFTEHLQKNSQISTPPKVQEMNNVQSIDEKPKVRVERPLLTDFDYTYSC